MGIWSLAASPAGRLMRFQHGRDGTSQAKIRVADDSRADPGFAIEARRAHGGDAVDELCLADHPQLGRAGSLVHGPALDKDGGGYVVPAVQIGLDLVHKIPVPDAVVTELPQVMVGVADGHLGIDRILDHLRKPFRVP